MLNESLYIDNVEEDIAFHIIYRERSEMPVMSKNIDGIHAVYESP